MRGLLRALGLVVTLALVSFTTLDAVAWTCDPYFPDYDTCHYTCTDGLYYQAYKTRQDCCGSMTGLWCPPGETPNYPGYAWGGSCHILDNC